jgi:succinate dehydrogenase/fumarate reductase flavoprotein subunit
LQLPYPNKESREHLFTDMIMSARTDMDENLVRNYVEKVNDTIETLLQWGLKLDYDDDGNLIRRSAGGLSEDRIVSSQDKIGPSIIRVLLKQLERGDLDILSRTKVTKIEKNNDSISLVLNEKSGNTKTISANTVICCTGGIAYNYAKTNHLSTTNPKNCNHELYNELCRLGLEKIHEDYFQHQPFGIITTDNSTTGKCVPESIINFPVRVLDRLGNDIREPNQDRYALTNRMFEIDKDGGSVKLKDGRKGFWLTINDIRPDIIKKYFPKLNHLMKHTLNPGENILVYPSLHYYLGGFKINEKAETNRLMGNGITDALVHGKIAANSAREYI